MVYRAEALEFLGRYQGIDPVPKYLVLVLVL
jgi:hypothetical protein